MYFLYGLVLGSFTVYSYALIDPNITFLQTRWWEIFRENLVYFGYYRRDLSWLTYLILVILLFVLHYFVKDKFKRYNPFKLGVLIGCALLVSFPFLSHDFINYMFDAKILTFYHQNPYLYKALDFPNDQWLRFMHWTHRTYPYGPVFLLITLVPSFLSFGKFILSFLLFKATFITFYLSAIYFLNRLDKKYALFFATHPLVIIEGLINSHNDLIAISLGIIGVYFLFSDKSIKSRLFFLFSGGVKFLSLPILFMSKTETKWNRIILGSLLLILTYLSVKSEIQPWYFINLFIFLPLFFQSINRLNIFFFGLLLSYYPYIRLGGWDTAEKVALKHWIIIISLILNAIYLLFLNKQIVFKRDKVKSK